ncbi:hypothetical protein CHRY9390_01423 [Chryseobacterium aquaeductus]|uniref:Uncharacterized protein n=1 Tax=Chryseobacterium aquaeductus TaxID=2675056 RepID=A0A9N8MG07_9FLAO|nr:hypothetical protein [Chryseobacterium aquaeductus]CAA7330750.1 hypothetical protein CHRY9390_01423 [Chryseobacterium potabilaquae]CAD7805820.1 hypothetical protein CHRY9390_01423 [Chryseobacterium aquaeductus]
MQNIQDLQEKIFFESKNIISILGKINQVDELLSKQNLVDELTERISFLKLLKTKVEYYQNSHSEFAEERPNQSVENLILNSQDFSYDVTEEEAIFNNELNEIDQNDHNLATEELEEEAIFNNQLNEIAENEYHENIINLTEEQQIVENSEEGKDKQEYFSEEISDEESVFDQQLNEMEKEETSEEVSKVLSFVDEERILENSVPEDEEEIDEEIFDQKVSEEEAIFSSQLNEIEEFENEISSEGASNPFEEEEQIQFNYEKNVNRKAESEIVPSIFDTEKLDDEILIEESDEESASDDFKYDEDEMITENSNVESILTEIKKESQTNEEDLVQSEDSSRRKIVDIDKPISEKDKPASDESFENLEAYQQEKKIRLANIKGLKSIQTLFDDDPLEREASQEKPLPIVKEDSGSLLKTNIPTNFMEAEKQKPEFRLDLNDRMAFTKLLFGGSQTDLNQAVSELNRCRSLEEAKEYLSELYYDRKWNKVDEYAQRLWLLVENKFL